MKLRIQGNSLRLRVTPSEISRLMETGRIEETIHFGLNEGARLTYALEHAQQSSPLLVRYGPQEMAVVVCLDDARRWASTQEVGLYGEVLTSGGVLEVAIEKDFSCLDKSDAENADRFPNPRQGTIC
jgi:hypothetical protein